MTKEESERAFNDRLATLAALFVVEHRRLETMQKEVERQQDIVIDLHLEMENFAMRQTR